MSKVAFLFVYDGRLLLMLLVLLVADVLFVQGQEEAFPVPQNGNSVKSLHDNCDLRQGPYTVPSNFVRNPSEDFPFVESGLQIFTDMKIPCSGALSEWQFIAKNKVIRGLHLGIFRSGTSDSMKLMSQTLITSTFINETDSWVSYKLGEPLLVSEGDVIGMFYDHFGSATSLLTIPSKANRNNQPPATIVLVMDSYSLSRNKTINVAKAVRDFRTPALAAVVLPGITTSADVNPNAPSSVLVYSSSPVATAREGKISIIVASSSQNNNNAAKGVPNSGQPAVESADMARRRRRSTTLARQRASIVPSNQGVLLQSKISSVSSNTGTDEQPILLPSGFNRQSAALPRRCLNQALALQECDSLSLRAFYDNKRGVCKPFYGCGSPVANANNFDTTDECVSLCGGILDSVRLQMTTPSAAGTPRIVQRAIQNCYEPPKSLTQCDDQSTRFYFDPTAGRCFSFDGCSLGDHRGNNFDSLGECQAICQQTPSSASTVTLIPFKVITAPASPTDSSSGLVPRLVPGSLLTSGQRNSQPSANNNNPAIIPYVVPLSQYGSPGATDKLGQPTYYSQPGISPAVSSPLSGNYAAYAAPASSYVNNRPQSQSQSQPQTNSYSVDTGTDFVSYHVSSSNGDDMAGNNGNDNSNSRPGAIAPSLFLPPGLPRQFFPF